MIWLRLLVIGLLTGYSANAQKTVKVTSPDGNLAFEMDVSAAGAFYTVHYKGHTLIAPSSLSLDFENGSFAKDIKTGTVKIVAGSENYTLHVGKAKNIVHPFRTAIVPLTETKAPYRKVNIAIKVFNDGAAFRYEIPEQDKWRAYTLLEERSTFRMPDNPRVHALLWGKFNNNHEGYYQKQYLSEIAEDTLMDVPALFEFPDNIFMAITEANLRNYAGMYLKKTNGILTSQLSPLQGQTRVKVKATLPHHTPWRVMLISDRVGQLIESNIITSLNDEPANMDWSWLKPGKTTFHWWNGDVDTDSTSGADFDIISHKHYIDFCARNGIEYDGVIGAHGKPWYMSDGKDYQPGPNTDITRLMPGFDMEGICRYAASKGVGVHTWVHWKALYPKIDEAFALLEKWGVKGMMVDFMDRDDQEMVKIQEEILQKAAQHKLYIQFHGAFKPTGLHRTYPNEFTREGTLNYENNKWRTNPVSPDHDIDMPFTRLLAGATDYHLGGFRAVPVNAFKPQFIRPVMVGTRCHMLAMYVVLESYLASLCDYPAAYEGQPGFSFLLKVPTTWDETKVLDAKVDEFIITARRKDHDWYIGGITNSDRREIHIPMDFLESGTYNAEIFSDAEDTDDYPNKLVVRQQEVDKSTVLHLILNRGGGVAIHLQKK